MTRLKITLLTVFLFAFTALFATAPSLRAGKNKKAKSYVVMVFFDAFRKGRLSWI